MKPGRKLDMSIHNRVMGVKTKILTLLEPFPEWHNVKTLVPFDCCAKNDSYNDSRYEEIVPNYSTSIIDARKIVKKINPRQFSLDYDTDYGFDKRTGWSVVIDGVVLSQFAETPELAICLAALKLYE